MTSLIYLVALVLAGQARSEVVELSCSDNATCIDNMARDFIRSIRQQRAVRLFDLFTIEPIESQARSNRDPISKFLTTHAISFDWNDFTFRFSNPEGRSDAMDLEVLETRSAKDVSDTELNISKSKDDDDVVDDKSGVHRPHVHIKPIKIKRKKSKHKVMQAIVPMLIGMKSAGIAIFGLFMVSVITIKAFMASKMALMVTIGMAVKKLYESYGNGIPETSNVLWNFARYFRFLFGLPETPLSAPSMTMPMYALPQMQDMQAMQDMQNMQNMQSQMFSPSAAMPTAH